MSKQTTLNVIAQPNSCPETDIKIKDTELAISWDDGLECNRINPLIENILSSIFIQYNNTITLSVGMFYLENFVSHNIQYVVNLKQNSESVEHDYEQMLNHDNLKLKELENLILTAIQSELNKPGGSKPSINMSNVEFHLVSVSDITYRKFCFD